MQCDIQPTDTVAVWGCGPVGQMAIRSAILLGAKQVIAIDRLPERLSMAEAAGAIPINFEEESTVERLNELTGGKGPEKCIDAVGLEAHATATIDAMYDRAKQAMMLETDRPHVLREMIYVCRPAGTLSIPGVYGGLLDKIPFGALMNKGLTVRTGQTHVNRWTDDLLRRILEGQIDPSFVITHRVPLDKGPEMYKTFRDKQDGCVKVMLQPEWSLSWLAWFRKPPCPGGPARCTTRWRRGSAISRSRSALPRSRCRGRSVAPPASRRRTRWCAATACARSRPASRS